MTDLTVVELAYAQGTVTYEQLVNIYKERKVVHYSGCDPDYDTTPIATYSVSPAGRSLQIVVLDTSTEGDYKLDATLAMLGQYLSQYPPFGHLAIESPEIYTTGPLANVRKSVILNLTQIVGAVTALWTAKTPLAAMEYQTKHRPIQQIVKALPKQWKGQKDKEQHHREIEERLNTEASKNSSSAGISLQVIKSRRSSGEKLPPPPTRLSSLAQIPSQYKSHVMDSVGLALFCHDRLNLLK